MENVGKRCKQHQQNSRDKRQILGVDDKIEESHCDYGLCEEFLDMTP